MRLTQNSRDNLLSLFLVVAKCSFVRLIEHDGGKSNRHQFGTIDQESLSQYEQNSEDFIQESIIEFEDYQFSFSVINRQHIHFECFPVATSIAENESRKSLPQVQTVPSHVEIDLFHSDTLPDYLLALEQNCASISRVLGSPVKQDKNQHLVYTFLKTMLVTVQGLQLVDQYIHLTRDSLTKLQSRTSLQREIDEQISHSSLALCMIHCIDFQHVNRKFGQAKGDKVLYEITHVINQYTRTEDISGRFGGALFGIAIHASSVEDGHKLAVKLQNALNGKHYLQNAIRLSFNIGVAFVGQQEAEMDNSSTSSLLINRAEQALKAAQNNATPSIVQWEPGKFRLDEQEFNYLGGIFTPDNVTNYRNMLLLWDISSIIADEHSFSRLLKSVIERLAYTFEFTYAGVITTELDKPRNYAFLLHDNTEIKEIDITECDDKNQLTEAASLAIENSHHTEHEEDGKNALIIPLGTATKECFFILGDVSVLDLTHDSVMLFVGFARQIGKALKRSQLEDELNRKLEQQNAKLEQELHELKTGMQSSALVYRSQKMQKIVEQTQRAAQTDTTVLVTGESGTGKEKLIHAIHNLSSRSNKPLIIVDCGSIPETLIESELFGHLKGAFTGAHSENKGKIHAANGGILVLDEIGELPISMQPKLLRFVQEKHYTPVGSNKSLNVDVKIVAVTNRDLAYEVTQGKFRKDLFYRLNVVTLHNPPLRERIEDIELLCQHFLSKFYRQFEMDKKILSERTIELMKAYDWPGNVRELENKLMQASLLTTGEEITFEDLKLDIAQDTLAHEPLSDRSLAVLPPYTHEQGSNGSQEFSAYGETASTSHSEQSASAAIPSFNDTRPNDSVFNSKLVDANATSPIALPEQMSNAAIDMPWEQAFSNSIADLLNTMSDQATNIVSIGSAIEANLLHMGQTQCGSHSKTALLLDIPVSTARRRLQKPLPDINLIIELAAWKNVTRLLGMLVDRQTNILQPLETVKTLVASEILKQHSANMTRASHLMGVSEPTMYKLRKAVS